MRISGVSPAVKLIGAVFLNLTLIVNQLSAELQQITFEGGEWLPYQIVGDENDTSGWHLNSGSAEVSALGAGTNGGKALNLPANSEFETHITRDVVWNPAETIAFVDFMIKPAANPENSLSNVLINGTEIAFQVPEGTNTGEVWVRHGTDGVANPEQNPAQWLATAGAYVVNQGGTSSANYIRLTLRHDYGRNLWDLFVDGKLAAANLAFDGRSNANLTQLEFFSSATGDTLLDDISALKDNMLFPDADKDGLPDAWEIANGSNPNLYDRDTIKPGTGKSFLDTYMDSLWPHVSGRGNARVSISGSIPALTLPTHKAVGSLKGSFSVGGDGAANYTIPIDLPKGTAGMEPKLSLSYSSNGGNGPLGLGWSLTGLQRITRGPSSEMKDGNFDPMDFDEKDRFFLDGQRLVCVSDVDYGLPGSEYRTEIDSYARIKAYGSNKIEYWTVETKAGLKIVLGGSDDTANSELTVGGKTLAWLVNKVSDTIGNFYTVDYAVAATENDCNFNNHRLNSIHYTGNSSTAPYCHVYFDYEDRPDTSRSFTKYAGYLTSKRLAKIRVLTGDYVNYSYRFGYQASYQTGRSLLKSVAKHMQDSNLDTLKVPATTFTYDGIIENEPLWRDPGDRALPVYGDDLDATGQVNSMVDLDEDGTIIRLTGDVSRAYKLPGNGIALNSGTRISFDFRSTVQKDGGAFIGLDSDTSYQGASSTALFRVGGDGSPVTMANGVNVTGSQQAYTGTDWQSYTLNIGNLGSGTKTYLVLICADDDITNSVDTAWFRNVRIYQNGVTPLPDPIIFNVDSQLPRYADADGNDMGVRTMDFNSDGLPDLSDWRAVNMTQSGNALAFQTYGNVFRNTGDGLFMRDTGIRPPTFLPLAARPTEQLCSEYEKKHHVMASPVDIDGDGKLDLLGSVNMALNGSLLQNEYKFYSLVGSTWTEKTGWDLPFGIKSISAETNGGKRRDQHFQWTDLNTDGYPDLVVHTSSSGRLYNPANGNLIADTSTKVAYLNKGKNGPGWNRNDNYALPVPLMESGKDVGRRLVDLDGDGVLEIAQARYGSSGLEKKTFTMPPDEDLPGSYRWDPPHNSAPFSQNDYDLPIGFVMSNDNDFGVIMTDLNGDGLPDLMRSHTLEYSFISETWLNHGLRDNNPWQYESEPTEDGQQADTYDFPYPLHYWCHRDTKVWRVSHGFQIADINGDGLQDIVYSDMPNTATAGSDNLVFRNTGNGWSKRADWGMPALSDGYYKFYNNEDARFKGQRGVKLEDLNGDGFPDLITGLLDLVPRVWYNNCRPEVLRTITDGFEKVIGVDYNRLNDPAPTLGFGERVYDKSYTGSLADGVSSVIDSRLVVSAYSEPHATNGTRYHFQRYGDLRYDRYNESSLGFGWIEALDSLTGQLTRTETSRVYPTGGSPVYTRTSVYVADDDRVPALGDLEVGDKILIEETSKYGELPTTTKASGTIRRPVQWESIKINKDLVGNIVGGTKTTNNVADFDAYGFVRKSTVETLDGTAIVTINQYETDTHTSSVGPIAQSQPWHLGRLKRATVTKYLASLTDPLVRTSEFTYDNDTGLLKSETIEPDKADFKSTKTYERDIYGNITKTTLSATGVPDRVSTATYKSSGRFLQTESNQSLHTVTYDYDDSKALLTSTTDPNGLVTKFNYDSFGTLTLTEHPDGTETGEATGPAANGNLPSSVSIWLPANGIVHFRAKQSSGSPVVKVYLDAFGRELVTETTILKDATASGGARYGQVYTITKYNWRGLKEAVSQPFFAGETINWTTITYDLLHRVLTTKHPDGKTDKLVHTATVIGLNGDGRPHTYSETEGRGGMLLKRWEDQHGRLVQSQDNSGLITTFTHDQDGRLLTASVGGVPLLTNTFDLLGNKTSVTEANSGMSSSTYNALGEVKTSTNARSQVTTTEYDSLGRPFKTIRPEGTYTTYYDASGALGKPWKITGSDGSEETITYDSLGRPIATRTKLATGQVFTTTTTYDALGRVVASVDAGGLMTITDYDPLYSFPVHLRIGPGSVGAGTALWTAGTFDSKGRGHNEKLANGVTRDASYNQYTGLVTSLRAWTSSGDVQNQTSAWDDRGNLASRSVVVTGPNNEITGRSETFTYDPINRLKTATVAVTSGSGPVPANATYSYLDDLNGLGYGNGNLTAKPGASLLYEGSRPHAVTSATIKGVGHTYEYDAAGYMTADKVGGQARREFTWTSFGQLASLNYPAAPDLKDFTNTIVHPASRVYCQFQFSAGGSRVRQLKERIAANDSRENEETFYLGSYEREIHSTKTNGNASPVLVKTVHRHSLGGFAVYTRTEKPGLPETVKLATLLKDHLGSTDVILTGTWNGSAFGSIQTERQSFDPWGERRDPGTFVNYRQTDTDAYRTSANDYDRGYTGHEQLDDSGLIHMNGRIYDPELGRMLSPDPFVQVPEYSQNFNRYSYVLNNPLNATDPTGYSWISDAFHSVGSWFKENWRTVVVIVVVAIVTWGVGAAFVGAAGTTGSAFATAATATTSSTLTTLGAATAGAIGGAVGGALGSALNGGGLGDILQGAAIGFVQGAVTGGMGNGVGDAFVAGEYARAAGYIVGHGVVGGAVNEAMGGKFQDGFLSGAAGAASQFLPFGNGNGVAGTIKAGVVGGTASVLGGGKFANGAYTAAFQYIVSVGLQSLGEGRALGKYNEEESRALEAMKGSYNNNNGGEIRKFVPDYSEKWGFSLTVSGSDSSGWIVAFRGTQMLSASDWYCNVLQALGIPNPQYKMAMQMARQIYDATNGNVTFVGHSLGGGLASAAALVTGAKAYTLNAAGLHPWTASGGNPNVTAMFIKGDVLSFVQDFSALPKAYGSRVAFDPNRFASPLGLHSSDNI